MKEVKKVIPSKEIYLKSVEGEIIKRYNEYQKDVSIQNVFTPAKLVHDILKRVGSLEGKDVLIVANYDIAFRVALLKAVNNAPAYAADSTNEYNYKSLTFLTDVVDLNPKDETKFEVVLANLNEPAKIDMMGKKFDVVIGNPPYNTGNDHRDGGSQLLAKDFVHLMIKLSKRCVAAITPYSNRTFNEKTKAFYISEGLYNVKICKSFPKVSQNIGVFFFDKETTAELDDEWTVDYNPVDRPLADIYKTVPGRTRQEVEHALKPAGVKGKYRYILTTSDIRYTDDVDIVGLESDRSYGDWRVCIPHISAKRKLGKPITLKPTDTVSHNVGCFVVGSEEEADKLVEHMLTDEFVKKMDEVKFGATNSKKFFKVVETPEFIK